MEDKASRWSQMKDSIKEREIKKTIVSHWHENKETYITAVVCVAGTWFLATRTHKPTNVVGIEGNSNTVEIIGTQNNFAPKRLSYIVTDGDRWWQTQNEAAKALGERTTDVSKHLNHGQTLKSGVSLQRVGVRS